MGSVLVGILTRFRHQKRDSAELRAEAESSEASVASIGVHWQTLIFLIAHFTQIYQISLLLILQKV
jgi:hypothetical protein